MREGNYEEGVRRYVLSRYPWFSLSNLGITMLEFFDKHRAMVLRIFKAKYFLSWDFLSVSLGHNPIYV